MLGLTVFLALFFLQTFGTYGHLACQSERDDVTAAERPYDHASQNLRAINGEIAFLNLEKISEKNPLKRQSIDLSIAEKMRKRDNEIEPAANRARNNLNNARRARGSLYRQRYPRLSGPLLKTSYTKDNDNVLRMQVWELAISVTKRLRLRSLLGGSKLNCEYSDGWF